MALAAVNFQQRGPQPTQLHIPEAISFPRAITHKGTEQPKPVLLFSGLAQMVLGASVLITLKMQLEFVLPTAIAACAWFMFAGLSGLCISCYVTTNKDHDNHADNPGIKKSFIICFRVYIGLLVVGVILTAATTVHGIYTDLSNPAHAMEAWDPGMSCMAFGILLTFLDCLIIAAVRKALRQYRDDFAPPSHPPPHHHPATVQTPTTGAPHTLIPCGPRVTFNVPQTATSGRGTPPHGAARNDRKNLRDGEMELVTPLLSQSEIPPAYPVGSKPPPSVLTSHGKVPPSYSQTMGFRPNH